MSALAVLLHKELHATFTSAVAYAVAAVFFLVTGYTFSLTLFFTKVANLTYIFHQMYVLLILLVPVLTMRAFAEERRADTLELLLTAPVHEVWIVLAKFLAALVLVSCLLIASGAYAVVLGLYGEPDWAPIYGGYLALFLLACLLVSIGTLASSLTENQVVAATCSPGACLMLWFADSAAYMLPSPLDAVAINLSLIGHFTTFVSGSLFLSDAGYYLTLSMLALFLTTRVVTDR
jgi:gliding motility-associated transport system permease protein